MGLSWGGYVNGNIPISAMHIVPNFTPIPTGFASLAMGSLFMKTEAAFQMSGMMQAFYRKFKKRLLLSEGYRSEGVQDKYWDRYINRKPGWTIAALPRTSIHGWGLSGDLAVEGVGNPSGEYLQWLRDNAAKYGFVNDVGAEPWHWSYRTDLVTRSIVITVYISDPNTDSTTPPASSDSTQASHQEDDMPRLVRISQAGNSLNGLVTALFPDREVRFATTDDVYRFGRAWGLIPAGKNKEAVSYAENINLAEYNEAMNEIKKNRDKITDEVAAKVWNSKIEAKENGSQPALARLAGADLGRNISDAAVKKIVAALPQTSGGAAGTIDEKKLADALAPAVANLLAQRLQS